MQSSDDWVMSVLKSFIFGLVCLFLVGGGYAATLGGQASVNVTSDTATTAKNMAFDEARRQIVFDALRQYVDVNALRDLMKNSKSSDLANLVSASSIDGEQTSDTTYSANITMVLDDAAVRSWLTGAGVQHWVPDGVVRDVFIVSVNMSDAVKNWADLNRIARNENFDLGTRSMTGNTALLELPTSVRGAFTIAIRESGWRYANQDGVLKIWK